MMKIKRFNESLKDKMLGKSIDQLKNGLMKLTPHGMLYSLGWQFDEFDEFDDNMLNELRKIANKRINDAINELELLLKEIPNNKLSVLVNDVTEWVERYGGNKHNILDNGFVELSEQIMHGGVSIGRHDEIIIYFDDVFNSFKELLKNFAIDEVANNNIDYNLY